MRFLTYFPTSKFLETQWWHKLGWWLAVWFFILSLYSILINEVLLVPGWQGSILSYAVIPVFIISAVLHVDPGLIISWPVPYLIAKMLGYTLIPSTFVTVLLLIIQLFLPTLLYRLFLYLKFGSSWRDKYYLQTSFHKNDI